MTFDIGTNVTPWLQSVTILNQVVLEAWSLNIWIQWCCAPIVNSATRIAVTSTSTLLPWRKHRGPLVTLALLQDTQHVSTPCFHQSHTCTTAIQTLIRRQLHAVSQSSPSGSYWCGTYAVHFVSIFPVFIVVTPGPTDGLGRHAHHSAHVHVCELPVSATHSKPPTHHPLPCYLIVYMHIHSQLYHLTSPGCAVMPMYIASLTANTHTLIALPHYPHHSVVCLHMHSLTTLAYPWYLVPHLLAQSPILLPSPLDCTCMHGQTCSCTCLHAWAKNVYNITLVPISPTDAPNHNGTQWRCCNQWHCANAWMALHADLR